MPKTKLAVATDDDEPDTEPEAPEPETPPTPELVEIQFRGTTFTIPKQRDEWDTEGYLELMRAADVNQYQPWLLAAKLLLGPQQWTQLRAIGPKRKDFDEFLAVFIPASCQECIG